MRDGEPSQPSPLGPHSSTPTELVERIQAERSGKAHVIYRDSDGRQVIRVLASFGQPVLIGRLETCDIPLTWDPKVSRLHARLEPAGSDWTVVDDGLSRNGSYVNQERLVRARRLLDGDTIVVGRTAITYRALGQLLGETTTTGTTELIHESVNAGDRRLLVALCRPLKDADHLVPATNQAIADELCLSLSAVKKRMSALFVHFELDQLPQAEKRSRLAVIALRTGLVTQRDLYLS